MKIRNVFFSLLLLCLLMVICPVQVSAEDEVIASGTMDAHSLKWEISGDGTLTIGGKINFTGSPAYPWTRYAPQIKRIVIEEGIDVILMNMFSGLLEAESVTIPDSVEAIESWAFYGCDFTVVTIPAKVKLIEESAFEDCTSLEEIIFAEDTKLECIENRAFRGTGLKTLTLPASVRTVGAEAFSNCGNLTTLTLQDGLETIGYHAFSDCRKLRGRIYLSDTIKSAGDCFQGCYNIQIFEINTGAYVGSFRDNKILTSVVFGGDANEIVNDMFSGCTALCNVTINTPVKSIGHSAFLGCEALSSIKLPDSLEKIENNAFSGSGITSIVLPDGLTSIQQGAFARCKRLTTVDCGEGVQKIESSAFKGCSNLSAIHLRNVSLIHSNAFRDCSKLSALSWPETLEKIYDNAFFGCSSLTTVTLAPTVKCVSSNAFADCLNLKRIVFLGDAPEIGYLGVFRCVTATAFYPEGNTTWTDDVMSKFGGDIAWVHGCTNHVEQTVPGVEASCVHNGRTEGKECSVCGMSLMRRETLPAHDHVYSMETVQVSCDTDGADVYTCRGCGHSYQIRYEDAFGHSMGDWESTKAPNHETEGENRRVCGICGYVEVQTLPVLPHVFGEWEQTKAPDIGIKGEERRSCTGCSYSETREIPALEPIAPSDSIPAETVQRENKPTKADDGNPTWIIVAVVVGLLLVGGGTATFVILKKRRSK